MDKAKLNFLIPPQLTEPWFLCLAGDVMHLSNNRSRCGCTSHADQGQTLTSAEGAWCAGCIAGHILYASEVKVHGIKLNGTCVDVWHW